MKVIDLINTMKDSETISVCGLINEKNGLEDFAIFSQRTAKELKNLSEIKPLYEKIFDVEVSSATVYGWGSDSDLMIYTNIDAEQDLWNKGGDES